MLQTFLIKNFKIIKEFYFRKKGKVSEISCISLLLVNQYPRIQTKQKLFLKVVGINKTMKLDMPLPGGLLAIIIRTPFFIVRERERSLKTCNAPIIVSCIKSNKRNSSMEGFINSLIVSLYYPSSYLHSPTIFRDSVLQKKGYSLLL